MTSQAELNNQSVKLQAEMSEIETLLATLTQQVISRPEEGNDLGASSSRTQERVDNEIPLFRFCETFSQNFLDVSKGSLL